MSSSLASAEGVDSSCGLQIDEDLAENGTLHAKAATEAIEPLATIGRRRDHRLPHRRNSPRCAIERPPRLLFEGRAPRARFSRNDGQRDDQHARISTHNEGPQ